MRNLLIPVCLFLMATIASAEPKSESKNCWTLSEMEKAIEDVCQIYEGEIDLAQAEIYRLHQIIIAVEVQNDWLLFGGVCAGGLAVVMSILYFAK